MEPEMSNAPKNKSKSELRNEDPITSEPGAHPVGVGVGSALGGAAVGALAGALGGPVGAVVGAVAGGISGAYGGKAVAESIDPTVDAYWRETYPTRPYFSPHREYKLVEPAYHLGATMYNPDSTFESQEDAMEERWESTRGSSSLTWSDVKEAARDAWNRRAASLS